MDTEAFIAEISKRESIWMSRHPLYKFKNVNKRLWNEIQICFPKFDVDRLRKKWKNLKDTFRKEYKKLQLSQLGELDAEGETASQWKYFPDLMFLKDEMPSLNETLSVDDDVEFVSRTEVQISPPSSPKPLEVICEPGTSGISNSQTPRKRSKANEIRAECLEIERKKLRILEEEVFRQQREERSDDYHYLMSILPAMEKLGDMQKMRVRVRINQILMDEMGLSAGAVPDAFNVNNSLDLEESETMFTPVDVKLEPTDGEASGPQVDPIAVEVKAEPRDDVGKRTNETLAPDVPPTNIGRGRKKHRTDDVTTQQHTQGYTSTARASSSVPTTSTRELDENSSLAEGAIKTEEIEIHEEGFS